MRRCLVDGDFFFYALHRSLFPGDGCQLMLEKRNIGKKEGKQAHATVLPLPDVGKSDVISSLGSDGSAEGENGLFQSHRVAYFFELTPWSF